MKELKLTSKLGPYIQSLVREKEAAGFSPVSYYWEYTEFDRFIVKNGFDDGMLSRELIEAWSVKKDNESVNTHGLRIQAARNIARHMISLGLPAFMPCMKIHREKKKPYIPTRNEIQHLFAVIDGGLGPNPLAAMKHLDYVYPTLFRLYYTSGLRLNEPLMLSMEDVNLEEGSLYIRHSKGDKDRIVYLHPEMTELVRKYDDRLRTIIPYREWFFPGGYRSGHLEKTTVCSVFQRAWNMAFPDWKGKRPTVHSLRHAFVMHRVNDWVEEGHSAEELFPYLSRYLGHSGIQETMYYYHANDTESGAMHKYLSTSEAVLREVKEWL